ncbi:MAG: cytochrome c family protein [bacterium]|nr:cytochrome c family protein [bacterium]
MRPQAVGVLLALLFWAVPLEASAPRYIGVDRCATCHSEAPKPVTSFWSQGPHAKAYKTLLGEPARALAAKLGLKHPEQQPGCLACHTTAAGVPQSQKSSSFKLEDGVSCEACHGPGQRYARFEVMSRAAMLRLRKPEKANQYGQKFGLVMPDQKFCATCHGPSRTIAGAKYLSPTYKGYEPQAAWEKIRHWP